MAYDIPQLFNNNFLITQFYGENVAYYQSIGLPSGHNGVDFVRTDGKSELTSVETGVVEFATFEPKGFNGGGNIICIYNADTDRRWHYMHCEQMWVKEGDEVAIGQEIGLYGNTGNSTGRHLHLNLSNSNTNWLYGIDSLDTLIALGQEFYKQNNNSSNQPENMSNQITEEQYNIWVKEAGLNRLYELGEYKKIQEMSLRLIREGKIRNFHIQSEEELNAWLLPYGLPRLNELGEKGKIIAFAKTLQSIMITPENNSTISPMPTINPTQPPIINTPTQLQMPIEVVINKPIEKFSFQKFFIGLSKFGVTDALIGIGTTFLSAWTIKNLSPDLANQINAILIPTILIYFGIPITGKNVRAINK